MFDVFINYSHGEQALALKVYRSLHGLGVVTWHDSMHLLASEDRQREIAQVATNSKYVLILASGSYSSSRNNLQDRGEPKAGFPNELLGAGGSIIVARVEECDPQIDRFQSAEILDLFPSYKKGLRKLLQVLLRDSAVREHVQATERLTIPDDVRRFDAVATSLFLGIDDANRLIGVDAREAQAEFQKKLEHIRKDSAQLGLCGQGAWSSENLSGARWRILEIVEDWRIAAEFLGWDLPPQYAKRNIESMTHVDSRSYQEELKPDLFESAREGRFRPIRTCLRDDHGPAPVGGDVRKLLQDCSPGDANAMGRLGPLIVGELCCIAEDYLAREECGDALELAVVINEAFMWLMERQQLQWQSRTQFFGVTAHLMRRILVDYARSPRRRRRDADGTMDRVLAYDNSLRWMTKIDPRASRVAEMRLFADMSDDEIAEVLKVSKWTVRHLWKTASMCMFH